MPIHLGKKFRRAGYGLIAAGLVTINEQTGYNGFDVLGAEFNLACAVDPTCRKLNDREIELARDYFGDDVDYSTINYFSRSPMWNYRVRENAIAVSALGNIFEVNENFYNTASEDQKDNVLLHEIMHVWQWQHGHLSPLKDRREHDGIYKYDIHEYENFMDFGIEQQGEIIQTIHRLRIRFEHAVNNGFAINASLICQNLNKHEEIAAQELPIEISDCTNLEGTRPVPEI